MLSILTVVHNTFGSVFCCLLCCSCSQTGSVFSGEAGVEEFYVEATQTNAAEGERDGRDGELFKHVRQTEHNWEQEALKYNNLFHNLIIYVYTKLI